MTGWTQEGQGINITAPDLDELDVTPPTLAGLKTARFGIFRRHRCAPRRGFESLGDV